MLSRSGVLIGLFSANLLLMLGLAHLVVHRYNDPFPPLSVSLSSPVATLSDFGGIALGFRKLTADLAWVQTILYYGTHEEGGDAEEVEQGGGRYPLFLAYCERVVQIDPNFIHAYFYGAGVLGWNLNRLDEAEKFLQEGIQAHPKEWRLHQFLAALAFQKNHDINKLVEFLEGFNEQEDCPNMLRSILANIYKKQKRYRESIRVWSKVYETGDPTYAEHSLAQIREMAPLAHTEPINRS